MNPIGIKTLGKMWENNRTIDRFFLLAKKIMDLAFYVRHELVGSNFLIVKIIFQELSTLLVSE